MPKRPKHATTPSPQASGRLDGVRTLAHDEDERPSREDRSYGETIFTRPPVPMPRILRGRRRAR
jgi:hypothetical protein